MPGMEGQVREQGVRKGLPTFRWLEKPGWNRNRIAMGRALGDRIWINH